ncbi:MAG: branched-chain amino acid ABC transporter permease, partial [Oscillospiraceae bacterium]
MGFVSNLISGLSLGSIYALIALGYTMVYGIAKMLNFAHGDLIMVGAFSAIVFISNFGLPVWLSVALSVVCCVVFGVLIEKIAYKPLRKSPPLSVLITAIGVSYFLQSLALIIFGSNQRSFPNIVTAKAVQIGKLTIKGESVVTLLATFAIMVGLTLFINKTKMGKAMRAVSEDKEAAELMGISVNRTITITFAIGSALAAVAGVFFGSTYGFVGPYSGSMPGIKAFVA